MSTWIYHITHLDNLPKIIAAGMLFSDARLRRSPAGEVVIGYAHIKEARLTIQVPCHPSTNVGDYVPFNFCPRSTMLYVINRGNDELSYSGGQTPIVHLVSTVEYATEKLSAQRMAFTDGNARTSVTGFFKDMGLLEAEVDWSAVKATDWRDPITKERKQAEFLVHDSFPWSGIMRIGVMNAAIEQRVNELLVDSGHRPAVKSCPSWYY